MYGKEFLGRMAENMQANGRQRRQPLFVRCCLIFFRPVYNMRKRETGAGSRYFYNFSLTFKPVYGMIFNRKADRKIIIRNYNSKERK